MKDNGWFSRRYETADRHRAAQAKRDVEKGAMAKAEHLNQRVAARMSRTPQEQIALLDQRLGIGQGATKERKRLLNPAPVKPKPEPKPKAKPMTPAEIAAGIEAYNPR